eukprot:CAMPEP_0174254912 /NCGR_PEP_ID=MMETSP0439-20130205/4261_1 /TAXON_ID=0 /ORGANISM="Stereomyxa ramosa, Strain Chinc5" /LENGTH=490 /DNA_ID=CAMNT_0015336807 /DNA_START=70 /DNA_END=1542 /DNA_ORIENTATION=-
MGWIKPVATHGGKTFWDTIRMNQYFILQKYKYSMMSPITYLKTSWSTAPTCEYRIIVSFEGAWHQIAESDDEDSIRDLWSWLEMNMLPLLSEMSFYQAYIFIIKYFSDVATNKDLDFLSGKARALKQIIGTEDVVSTSGEDALFMPESDVSESKEEEEEFETNTEESRENQLNHDFKNLSLNGSLEISGSFEDLPSPFTPQRSADDKEEFIEGLEYLPEQYTQPLVCFNWIRSTIEGTSEDGWEYFMEKEEVYVSKKALEGTPYFCYKGVGLVQAEPSEIMDFLLQVKWTEWDSTLKSIETIQVVDSYNEIQRYVFTGNYPILAPRDMICFKTWHQHPDGSFLVYLRSVDHQKYKEQNTDKNEEHNSIARIETLGTGFVIEKMKNTNFCMISFVNSVVDMKSWTPPRIIGDYIAKKQPLQLVNLIKMLNRKEEIKAKSTIEIPFFEGVEGEEENGSFEDYEESFLNPVLDDFLPAEKPKPTKSMWQKLFG